MAYHVELEDMANVAIYTSSDLTTLTLWTAAIFFGLGVALTLLGHAMWCDYWEERKEKDLRDKTREWRKNKATHKKMMQQQFHHLDQARLRSMQKRNHPGLSFEDQLDKIEDDLKA